jgi:hypothetical protein
MKIEDMIRVLDAARCGAPIEVYDASIDDFKPIVGHVLFNMPMNHYRIAPKKSVTLVEELRNAANLRPGAMWSLVMFTRAADRIEELESRPFPPMLNQISTD